MGVAVDNVERLWPLLQCSLDKCTTTAPITGLTGREPQACETGPIIMQTGIDRFHDIENALKLARAPVEDQITTKLRDDQQVTGIGSDIRLSGCKVGVRVFKQCKERGEMRTLSGQRSSCCQ